MKKTVGIGVRRGLVRRRLQVIAGAVLVVLLLLTDGFIHYVSDYYRADAEAWAVMAQAEGIEMEGDLTILASPVPTDTALVFYPGGKVEPEAYLPLLDQIRQDGVTCILVHMPFNLAFFDVDAAQDVMVRFPGITHWYVAGHSLGGVMASAYASEHPGEVDGLILLGAYVYGDFPAGRALTVYGSLNQNVEDRIDYTENVVEIEGGNHAQFGNYGPQKGDVPAAITADEQQAQAVAAIREFIARNRAA
ncbi:MAG: alpha/beta fold hydrolase [Actinomycetota bacterium]|nr:alpha/beta fold hydrolase [Actinomycetota bacterium]